MTPTPKRQTVIVGLFTGVAIAILAGGILTIGDINETFTRRFSVSAVFPEVSGLKEGDNIWFSGLKVGIVKTLSFHSDSQVQVEMRIDEHAAPFIHRDALAKIGSDGLIGSRIVVLYGGTPEAPGLEAGDVLNVGDTVSTEQIMATLQENSVNLLAITTDVRAITAKVVRGEGTLGKLLADEALYANVAGATATLGDASKRADSAAGSLAVFAAELNREGGLPHELVTDRTSYAALRSSVVELQTASARASDLVDGLAQGSLDPRTPVGALLHDEQAGTDLRVTLDNLSRGSRLLAEDLEAVQHNFLFRGYFRKKAKAEEGAPLAAGEPGEEETTAR